MPDGDARKYIVYSDSFVSYVIIHYIAVHHVSSTSQPMNDYKKADIRVYSLTSCRDLFCFEKPLKTFFLVMFVCLYLLRVV